MLFSKHALVVSIVSSYAKASDLSKQSIRGAAAAKEGNQKDAGDNSSEAKSVPGSSISVAGSDRPLTTAAFDGHDLEGTGRLSWKKALDNLSSGEKNSRMSDIGIFAYAGSGHALGFGIKQGSREEEDHSGMPGRKLQEFNFSDICQQGHVDCDNGKVRGSTAETCEAGCAGKCCVDDSASIGCDAFTGKVCKDGQSCTGQKACKSASIPHVYKSCTGREACYKTGYNGGSFGELVSNSCLGKWSCKKAGAYDGSIGDIYQSCYGTSSCSETGSDDGSVGDISYSCIGGNSCDRAGEDYGSVGDISHSCVGDESCVRAGRDYGSVGDISHSCVGDESCDGAGGEGGSVGDISYSCIGYYSCEDLGTEAGYVGDISHSCVGKSSCGDAGEDGSVGDISYSCLGDESCEELGDDGGSVGDVSDSCVGLYSCYNSGEDGGSVGDLVSSCSGYKACHRLGEESGSVGDLVSSCSGLKACMHLGSDSGKVGNLEDSCSSFGACMYLGSNRDEQGSGLNGDLTSSCNAFEACNHGAYFSYETADLNCCCNSGEECQYFNQGNLTDTCATECTIAPTEAPTKNPISTLAPVVPSLESSIYFPDWVHPGSEICLNDGSYAPYIKASGFFEQSLEDCCERFFSWNMAECLGDASEVVKAYHPNWGSASVSQCLIDEEPPQYMINSGNFLYESAETCCGKHYKWDFDNCMINSGASSRKGTG